MSVYECVVAQAPTFGAVIAANVKAERARLGIKQASLAARMRRLGFDWHPQTVGNVERGERRLTAEEVLCLALALRVPVSALMRPQGPTEFIRLPSGQEIRATTVARSVLFHYDDESVTWDGDKPVFGEPTGAARDETPWRAVQAVLDRAMQRAR